MSSPQKIISQTRSWLRTFVIGMNLCPFAGSVFREDKIRYIVSEATDERQRLEELILTIQHLSESSREETETTLIIYPGQLEDFAGEYLDFISIGEAIIEEGGWAGEIQIASFHPQYQFEGTAPHEVGNFTNRSPYPILHLLREESVSEALDQIEDPDEIPERNIRKMEAEGYEKIRAKWLNCLHDAS